MPYPATKEQGEAHMKLILASPDLLVALEDENKMERLIS